MYLCAVQLNKLWSERAYCVKMFKIKTKSAIYGNIEVIFKCCPLHLCACVILLQKAGWTTSDTMKFIERHSQCKSMELLMKKANSMNKKSQTSE